MITHNLSFSINTDGRSALSGTQTETGSSEISVDQNVSSGYTDLAVAFAHAALQSVILLSNQNMTVQVGGTDEVQQIATTGTVTAGTFTVTFGASTSAAIAWNATAAIVQAALEAMASIGTGNVACGGGPLPATPVTLTFKGAKGRTNVAQVTTTDTLTGGSTSVSTTTAGVAPDATIALLANSPLQWSKSQAYFTNPFPADVTTFRVNTATANRLRAKFLIA
jgi:hypothetical protein